MELDSQLDPKYAILGVFVVGAIVGFGAGLATPFSLEGSSSSTGLVELNQADYPYEGVEAGVADHNITNHTVEGEPYLGSADADVNMVAYEEFQCPFCKQYNQDAFPQIMDEHIEEGNVRYYMKAFLIGHPWAVKGHVASECALNQDAETYWTFKHGFFTQQDALNQMYERNSTQFDESMIRWAEQTDLDVERFTQCYDNQETRSEVIGDYEQGRQTGVSGTPTVFVGSQKLVGAQPFSRFNAAIMQESGQ